MNIVTITRNAALLSCCALIASGCGKSTQENSQVQKEFYKGKTITLIVGSGAAGGDDVFARLVAKYLPKYLPGSPTVVVQNLPGAGGQVAAAQMFHSQPRDGTVIAAVLRTVPMMPLVSEQPVNFDPRQFNLLGSLGAETNTIVVWNTSPDKTFDDVFKRETVVGTTGGSGDTNIYPLLLNRTLGTKFKVVTGYPGGPDIDLAMERGEVEGRVSITWTSLKATHGEWLRDKKIRILAQMGLQRNPELPDVPNVMEYVKDPKVREVYRFLFTQQQAGRPFVAPPGVPADRLAALRIALIDVANDQDFRADVQKTGGMVSLMTGEDLQKMVNTYYTYPPDVIKAARAAMSPN
jgi:tripartite-type tricarboxylate transporter receptor subunit TctC